MTSIEIREVVREAMSGAMAEIGRPFREGRGEFSAEYVKADIEQFGKDQVKVCERLADVFVGPKLPKKMGEDRCESRDAARKVFIEGRAGL